MALVLFQTRRVRERLKAPASLGIDLLVLVVVICLAGALFSFGREVAGKTQRAVHIDLHLRFLPLYTFFSLSRGFAAYFLSLAFTLAYGTIAAHNRRAEKIMVPVLDVLQSIPVLSFCPVLVVAMIHLFPGRELGLEVACVLQIFTAQVWNMTFSYYSSVRNIPNQLREVAAVNCLSKWQIFRLLELPASMIGLVWNSMMSMAGGWFFLTVNEALVLGNDNYSLPGLGSYMSLAIGSGNVRAEIGGVVAMILMIVAVDQLFWRPIVAWSERFKVEETAETDKAQSWVLSLLQKSLFYQFLMRQMHHRKEPQDAAAPPATPAPAPVAAPDPKQVSPNRWLEFFSDPRFIQSVNWAIVALLAFAALWGGVNLVRLLLTVGPHDWQTIVLALVASFLRTTTAVLLGGLWTLPVGILIGLSARWSQRLQPIVQVLASFPAPMLFPFAVAILAFFHIPFSVGCISLMLLGTQWYVLFNVIAGSMAIPTELKEVGTVYHTPRARLWKRIYIPGVFPYLVTGLITAAGGAWNATIVSEYFQPIKGPGISTFGLGTLIARASADGDNAILAASTVTMAVAVVFINRFMWKRLYRLAESRYSLNV